MKIEGSGSASGSGSISLRHGSADADADPDPDPHQYVMDPQHCLNQGSPIGYSDFHKKMLNSILENVC
jgi:hypothetical protein